MPCSNVQNVTLANEQFEPLLARIADMSSLETNTVERETPTNFYQGGSFAKCTAWFDRNDTAGIDAFLDATETYKECISITDVNAYQGFTMLLECRAATWWGGVKQMMANWYK